jgi:hypothetical protein
MAAMAGGDTASAPAPSLHANPTCATGTAGACSGASGDPGVHVSTPATIVVSWVVDNADAALYGIKVYKDGVLKSTQGGASTSYTYTVSGFTQDDATPGGSAGHPFTSAYVFRVDIYRLSDGTVADSKTASTWAQAYADCTGPV